MQLIKIVLIIILVYYLLKIMVRYLLPVLMRYFIRKTFEDHRNATAHTHSGNSDLHVENPGKKTPRKKDNLGEYIEYQEINDD